MNLTYLVRFQLTLQVRNSPFEIFEQRPERELFLISIVRCWRATALVLSYNITADDGLEEVGWARFVRLWARESWTKVYHGLIETEFHRQVMNLVIEKVVDTGSRRCGNLLLFCYPKILLIFDQKSESEVNSTFESCLCKSAASVIVAAPFYHEYILRWNVLHRGCRCFNIEVALKPCYSPDSKVGGWFFEIALNNLVMENGYTAN